MQVLKKQKLEMIDPCQLLPNEIFYEILQHLFWFERIYCSIVSKSWNKKLDFNSDIWRIWIMKDKHMRSNQIISNYKRWLLKNIDLKPTLHEKIPMFNNSNWIRNTLNDLKDENLVVFTMEQFIVLCEVVFKPFIKSKYGYWSLEFHPKNNSIYWKFGETELYLQILHISSNFELFRWNFDCQSAKEMLENCRKLEYCEKDKVIIIMDMKDKNICFTYYYGTSFSHSLKQKFGGGKFYCKSRAKILDFPKKSLENNYLIPYNQTIGKLQKYFPKAIISTDYSIIEFLISTIFDKIYLRYSIK